MKRLPVFDVVAEDWWEYEHEGQPYVAHVSVGRPRRDDDGAWVSPLKVEGAHAVWNPFSSQRWKGWKPIEGMGPLDALMNALMLSFKLFKDHAPRSVAGPIRELERPTKLRAGPATKKKKKPARGRARR